MLRLCVRCGRPAHHRHHVKAKGMGGSKILEKGPTIDTCWECHVWIHQHPAQALADGYRELRNTA